MTSMTCHLQYPPSIFSFPFSILSSFLFNCDCFGLRQSIFNSQTTFAFNWFSQLIVDTCGNIWLYNMPPFLNKGSSRCQKLQNYKTRNLLWLHSKNNCKNIHTIVAIYKRTKLQKYGYVSTDICYSALMLSVNLFNGVKIVPALLIVMRGLLVRHEPRKYRERWRQKMAAGRALTTRLQKRFPWSEAVQTYEVRGHREDTSSPIARHFSFHGKIYISTFLS